MLASLRFFFDKDVVAISNVVKLLVGGIDYSPYVDIGSVNATNNVLANQDGMSFVVYITLGAIARPRAGAEVVWGYFDAATGSEVSRSFAGVLTKVTENIETPLEFAYTCDCQSYLRWFDKRLVNGFFQQQSAETTIKQVIDNYCAGFTYNHVSAPLTVPPQYAEYRRPSDFVKQVVDQIGYGWYVDAYKDVHVYKLENFASPLPNNTLDADNDYINAGDLELTEDAENVWTRYTLRGFKVRAPQPYMLYFTGDGQTTQWSLGYRFSSAKGDTVVTVGGTDYPVVQDILNGLPGQSTDPTKAYVHWTQHLLRFVNAPAPGVTIAFRGYPLVQKTAIDQNDFGIAYMKTIENNPSSDGIYEFAELDRSLTQSTMDAIRSKLELLALKYGLPTMSGALTSYTSGWRAGQSFKIVSSNRMDGITADTTWYVYRVTKRWIQPQHDGEQPIQYRVEFADKPYLV